MIVVPIILPTQNHDDKWQPIEPWFGAAHHIWQFKLMQLVALPSMNIKCPHNWSLSRFKHAYILSTHPKDLSHARFMLVLQNALNAVLGLLYLAGAMDAACGCAANDHTDICLFNYSTTYPSNILIVGSSYRFDFTLFHGFFFLQNLNAEVSSTREHLVILYCTA